MKKIILTVIIFLSTISLYSQSDSLLKKYDLNRLYTLIVNNFSIYYSELLTKNQYGLDGETVFFEINLQDNKVKDVQIWHKEGRYLYDIAQKIAAKIMEEWKPVYKFPQTILWPFCVKMSTNNPQRETVRGILVKDWNIYFSDEIIDKIKSFETEHFLVMPSPFIIVGSL